MPFKISKLPGINRYRIINTVTGAHIDVSKTKSKKRVKTPPKKLFLQWAQKYIK